MKQSKIDNFIITLAVLLLLPAFASASGQNSEQTAGISEEQLKTILPQLIRDTKEIEAELEINLSATNPKTAILVVGDSLSSTEKTGLSVFQSRYQKFLPEPTPASKANMTQIVKSGRIVVLVGGPSQNKATNQLQESGALNGKNREYANQLVITTAKNNYGTKFIVVSDKRGFVNLPRKAAEYSPLALCLPLQWVPVVASAIGAILVSIMNVVKAYIESFIADKAKKGKTIGKARKIIGIKPREVISIAAAAFVLGLSVSWTFAGPTFNFLWLLILNTLICLFAGLSHEIIHWLMGRILGIKTEYRLWISGSVTTIFTAILGNSFGLQGFLLEDIKEGTARWKVGLMKLASPYFSTAVMILFATINFFLPHVAFQMVYSIASVLAMADILPFSPMDGHEIRKWNIFVWLASFTFITASFVFVNFIL